jgi:alkylation response protein AidB-like acyl-CoA dehydrogenase
MDFHYTSAEEAFRAKMREWLKQTSAEVFSRRASTPGSAAAESSNDRRWRRMLEYHRRLYDAGYVALHWPKEYGGGGATMMEQAIYQDEALSLALPSTAQISSRSIGSGRP